MPRTNPEARERLVATAADMLRRRGLSATSIRELAKAAHAPLGSTYHYFPEGKKQVVTEAVQYAGNKVSSILEDAFAQGPAVGLDAFLALWRDVIVSCDFKAGCPIIAVAMVEPSSDEVEAARIEAAKVLDHWQKLIARSVQEHGVGEARADQLATMIIASAEGALAMCRAKKDVAPFDVVTDQLRHMMKMALP